MHIPVTQGTGFAWPSFLNNLSSGTVVTVSGTPSYADAWSQSVGCPTGGLVASAITLGTASPAPTASPISTPVPSGYVYAAPWNGFAGQQTAILNPQGACSHIPVTRASGFSWPALLNTLPAGTPLRIYGTASYADSWSRANGCPTGGIVATNIALAGAVVSPTATPIGVPTATPTASPGPVGVTYSSRFTGNTPFHETVATLINKGAQQLSSTIANNFWAQGQNGPCGGAGCDGGWPMWVANPGTSYTFHCKAYGTCGEDGQTVNYPSGAAAQCVGGGGGGCNYDYHIITQDLAHGIEVDGWECQSGPGQCAWGAGYPFSGSGLSYDLPHPFDDANAGGYALGLYVISYADIASGAINHAIGGNFSCDSGNNHVYPSYGTAHHTCNGGGPTITYGDMVTISSGVDINTLTSNQYCKQVLTAMQKFGFYPMDTNGGSGTGISVEPSFDLPSNERSLWINTIEPQLACLGHIPSGDIKVYQLAVRS
jgi:hypothetical protein